MYDGQRDDMLPFIPAGARRVLDVGCATGNFGVALKAHRDAVVWGIDPTQHPEERPNPYARRVTGSYPEDLPAGEMFDCIVFNDVLEHMVDPWEVLRVTRCLLAAGGVVVASIPNVRHISALLPLLRRGEWRYAESGILDRSHLRFFTRSTMIEMFESTGYTVEQATPHWLSGYRWGALNRRLRGRLDEFVAHQYAIVAH